MASLRLLSAACLTGCSAATRLQSEDTLGGGMVAPRYSSLSSPEFQAAVQEATKSLEFLSTVEVLEDAGDGQIPHVRGCQVKDPNWAFMQALQNRVGWTVGFHPGPSTETRQVKELSLLDIMLKYRQPLPCPIVNPQHSKVFMLDYVMDTIFGVPMRAVGPTVQAPQYQTPEGETETASWVEADWGLFLSQVANKERPPPPSFIFLRNCYPYCAPTRHGDTEVQQTARHYVLWYFNYPWDALPNPSDDELERDVHGAVRALAVDAGFAGIDYVWYKNPGASVPEVFHVQVFWIVPNVGDHRAAGSH